MEVRVIGDAISEEEKSAYIQHAKEQYKDREISLLEIKVDGDYVDLSYHFKTQQFEIIRRITGYLVGTLDRFNDAKRAEVEARVKHMTKSNL